MNSRASVFARCLAFVALFCALGLQAGEVQHSHGIDEPVAECLFCKSSSGADAAVNNGAPVQPERATYTLDSLTVKPAVSRLVPPTARGPPPHS